MKKKLISLLGILMVFFGAILGAAFFGAASWADYEALFFEGSWKANDVLASYNCPALIGKDEVGEVTLDIQNKADRMIRPAVRTRISEGFVTLVRQDHVEMEIEPGGREALSWSITGEDAAYDRIIMVRIYRYAAYPYDAQYAACGILVGNLGILTGQQAEGLIVGGSLLMMGLGIGMFFSMNRNFSDRRIVAKLRSLSLMAGLVTLGLITVWLNAMVFGVLVFFISALMILSVALNFISVR